MIVLEQSEKSEAIYENFCARHELRPIRRGSRSESILLKRAGLISWDDPGLIEPRFQFWDHPQCFHWAYAKAPATVVITGQPYGIDVQELGRLVEDTGLRAFVFPPEHSWHNPGRTNLVVLASPRMSGSDVFNSFNSRFSATEDAMMFSPSHIVLGAKP